MYHRTAYILKVITVSLWFMIYKAGVLSQTQTSNYQEDFTSYNMDMWGSGGFDPNNYFEFFNESWDEGGPIDMTFNFFGMRFGPYFDVHTMGEIAMGFGLQGFTSGVIDSIFYPASINFITPQSGTFNAGEMIRIFSNISAENDALISPSFPSSGALFLDYTFGAHFYFNIGICGGPLGCTDTELDFGTEDGFGNYEPFRDTIFKLTTDPTDSSYAYGFADWPVIDPALQACLNLPPSPIPEKKYFHALPVEIEADASRNTVDENNDTSRISNPFINASLDVPYIATNDYVQTTPGSNIVASGNDEYISMGLDLIGIAQTAAGVSYSIKGEIPVIPCVMSIEYSFFDAYINLHITNHQEFTFTPEMKASLKFPSEVYYEVYNEDGYLIDNNTADSISYNIGHELRLKFPCDYNFMDLEPSFVMEGNLHNHTFDRYSFDITLAALTFTVHISEIIIIPAFDIPICFWNPFGDDWCTTIHIPEVGFEEQAFPLGPVWNPTIPLGSFDVDWFDDDIPVSPFNMAQADPFRIRPVESTIALTASNVLCHGDSTGSVNLIASGSNNPLSYHWSNGANTRNISNLPAGEYYVRVTDASGCTNYQGVTVNEPDPIEIEQITVQHISCYNGSDGSVLLETDGGSGILQYLWSTGDTTNLVSGLTAGTYYYTVSDGNCTLEDSVILKEPTMLQTLLSDMKNPDCAGNANGYIEIAVQGGTEPYSYLWSNLDVTDRIENLNGGTYSVIVSDGNGCTDSISHILTEPDPLEVSVAVTDSVSCYQGMDGSLELNISGGTPPYDVSWYGPENKLRSKSTRIDSLPGGLYRTVVTDQKGCSGLVETYLPTPAAKISSSLTESHVRCFDGNDGSINLTVENAQGNVTFQWSNGSNSEDLNGISAGKYEVEITDSKECKTYNNTFIIQPREIIITDSIRNISCTEESDGAIKVFASGGFEPYSYRWSSGEESDSIGSLGEGTYQLTIADARGCEVEKSYSMSVINESCIDIPNAFTPNNDSYNDTWRLRNIELYPNAHVMIFTKWGELIYEAKGAEIKPWDGKYKGKDLPANTYYYILDLGDGSDVIKGSVTLAR